MTKKRIATLATCLTLVGAVAVGGTLALLTSGPKNITNTFAVSNSGYDEANMDFIVREHQYTQDESGNYDSTNVPTAPGQGLSYHNLVADTYLDKDPYFTLRNADNEPGTTPPDSWVVAKIDPQQVLALQAKGLDFSKVTESGDSSWFVVKCTTADGATTYQKMDLLTVDFLNDVDKNEFLNTEDNIEYCFIYNDYLTAEESTTSLFTQLSVGDDLVTEGFSGDNNLPLEVKGVAVQKASEATTIDNSLSEIMADAYPLLFPAGE